MNKAESEIYVRKTRSETRMSKTGIDTCMNKARSDACKGKKRHIEYVCYFMFRKKIMYIKTSSD